MQTVVAIFLVGFFGTVCWMLLSPSADCIIRFSRGAVRFRGKFPRSRQAEVEEFLKREFGESGTITISVLKARPGTRRVVIRGPISDGDRQRIRNFFQTIC
jgi:hypothetical protein